MGKYRLMYIHPFISLNLLLLEITLRGRRRNFSIMGKTSSGFISEGLSLEYY